MLRRLLPATTILTAILAACSRQPETLRQGPGQLVLHGRIEARSSLPDPKTSPYADAYYTARFAVLGAKTTAPAKATLLLPGFFKRSSSPASAYRPDDLIEVLCIPFDAASPEQQSIQQADDLGDVDLPVLLAVDSRRIDRVGLPAPSGGEAKPARRSVRERNEYRTTPAEDLDRRQVMAAAREDLARREAAHGGWDAWMESVRPHHEELKRKVAEAGGVLKQGRLSLSDLSVLDARFDPASPEAVRMIQSLVQLQDLFMEGGTHLILAPFPDRSLVAAPRFLDHPPDDGVLHPHVLRLQAALLDAGLEMLDVQGETLAGLGEEDFLFFYDSPDPHPAEGAVRVLAGAVDARLKRYDLPRRTEAFQILHKPYRGPVPFGGGEEREAKRADKILDAKGAPLVLDTRGPVLFLGDSFLESPAGYGTTSTGLAYQFAYLSGVRPGVFERKSGAFHMLRYVLRQPQTVFPDRKVAVLVTSLANFLCHPGAWSVVDLKRENEVGVLHRIVFPSAEPVCSWNSGNGFSGLEALPASCLASSGGGMLATLGDGEIRIRLPLPRCTAGVKCLILLTLKSTAYADATLRSGESADKVAILKGDNRMLAEFVSDGKEAWLSIPPGTGSVAFKSVDIRRAP